VTWRKLGLVFQPRGERPWLVSHAANPVVLGRDDGSVRVFFASRDARNRSHVASVDLELEPAGARVTRVASEPVLSPGELGFFDDHGVYPSSIVERDGSLLLYYTGWNPSSTAPVFYTSIGLAVSNDGGDTFHRYSRAPIMARSEVDPWMTSQPFVLHEYSWRMWYISGLGWDVERGELWSRYHIKYAESRDGIVWQPTGRVAIDLIENNRNIARPCILHDESRYRAWYSYTRGIDYRIGYAESSDGLEWTRLDGDAGIDTSDSGWDSKALAYPYVFRHNGRLYMLYNGNGHGREGFGLAVHTARNT
jgi:hypothetical protein